MQVLRLTDDDVQTIINALTNEARTCRNAAVKHPMPTRVHDALLDGAKAYTDLAAKIEDADRVIYEG